MLFDAICDPTMTAIDIGCGNGLFTKNMTSQFKSILSIDINPIRVRNLKEYFIQNEITTVTVMEMSAYEIEMSDESVDRAIFYRSIDHISDYGRALKEAYRVLKKEGKAYINILDTRVTNERIDNMDYFRRFADELYDELKIGEGMCEIKYVDIGQLKVKLLEIGFKHIHEQISKTTEEDKYLGKIDNGIKANLSRINKEVAEKYMGYNARYEDLLGKVKRIGIELRPTVEIICQK